MSSVPAVTARSSRELAHFLAEHQVEATLIEPGADMATVALAAAALGVMSGQIVKSIVFEGKKAGGTTCLAIAPGDIRVAVAKVASALQLNQLKLAAPATVSAATGYAVGGVPPVGHLTALPVVVDQRVLDCDVVFGGGGDEQHMLRIAPGEIVRLTGAIVADIAADPVAPAGGTP
jgi:prolyl-tRNA editing enzyme YbaK/EbsC (Cys-tRNA(Pro) deacylase)